MQALDGKKPGVVGFSYVAFSSYKDYRNSLTIKPKIKMKAETFTAIPGYKKAETNGKFVRSSKSKQMLCVKKGTNKYQLFNDAGKRCLIALEEINALVKNGSKPQPVKDAFPVKKKAAKKAVAEKRPAGEKVKKQTKTEKCYSLHLQGKNTEQIMKATGCPRNAVTRNIWLYTSGKKVY